jgi:hypothetical protein
VGDSVSVRAAVAVELALGVADGVLVAVAVCVELGVTVAVDWVV